jgi:hypothetical protein
LPCTGKRESVHDTNTAHRDDAQNPHFLGFLQQLCLYLTKAQLPPMMEPLARR